MNYEKLSVSDEWIERGKGLLSLWFFSSQYLCLLTLPTSCMQVSTTPMSGPDCSSGLQYVSLGKKIPTSDFFMLIPSWHPTGDHPLKYYLLLQYSGMLLAVFPSMCQILTEWFHQFLHLDLLVILLRASLTEMWIFNFKLDITSLTDTQVCQP